MIFWFHQQCYLQWPTGSKREKNSLLFAFGTEQRFKMNEGIDETEIIVTAIILKWWNQANNRFIPYKNLILSHGLNNISHYFLSHQKFNSTIIYKDPAMYIPLLKEEWYTKGRRIETSKCELLIHTMSHIAFSVKSYIHYLNKILEGCSQTYIQIG